MAYFTRRIAGIGENSERYIHGELSPWRGNEDYRWHLTLRV